MHPAYWEQAMGGAELQIFYLVKHLRSLGCEVHYIFEDKQMKYSNSLNVQLHPLKLVKIKKTFGQRWFLYKTQLEHKLNEIKPDAIYTRFYSSWSGVASLYANKNKCKHIWAVAHDNDVKSICQKKAMLKPFNWIEYFFMKKTYKNAHHILVQNNFQQNALKQRFNRKGIKLNQSAEFVEEDLIRKREDIITVLWVANLKPMKRPEKFLELVDAFKNHSNLRFKMIGRLHMDYKEAIDHASSNSENFEYLNEISNSDVNKELLKSHILVNTSDFEGFSNTFVQAWMRKVVVLSMNSNPDEILTTKEIGYVCPSVERLAEKIEILLQNSELRKAMGQKAYTNAVAEHNVEKNIDKVVSLMS